MRATRKNRKNNRNTRKIKKSDPLYKVKKISDPITIALYVKDGKRILLLGDRHAMNKNCKTCKAPDCLDYLTLVETLHKYHKDTETDLDVFIETFAPSHGKSTIEKGIRYLFTLVEEQTSPIRLFDVRKALTLKTYFHGNEYKQRYHYIDYRLTTLFAKYGFNLIIQLHGSEQDKNKYYEDFLAMYPTKSSYINIIKQFCFAKKFDTSLQNRSLLSHGMTKTAKQFNKLPSKEQRFVKQFIIKNMNHIMTTYNYKKKDTFFNNVLFIMVLIMDTYAICRFLYYHAKQPEGSTSIFIAGAFHTQTYSSFMKEWGAKKIYEHRHDNLPMADKACHKVDFKSLIHV